MTTTRNGAANGANWAKIGVITLYLVVVAVGFWPFAVREYTEADLYVVAGNRMRAGEEIYRLNERPFTYPPLLAVPCVLLSYLPATLYRLAWYLTVCATLTAVVWLVLRRVRSATGPAGAASVWLFWGVTLLLAARHLLAPVENQSHDLLIFLCAWLAIDAWAAPRRRSSDMSAGGWAGLAAALKATPLLFLPFFLWQRRWLAVAVMVIAGIGLSFSTDWLWPRRDGASWSMTWYRTFLTKAAPGDLATTPAWDPWCPLNQSVTGTWQRLLTPLPPGADRWEPRTDVSVLSVGPTTLRLVTLATMAGIFGWLLWTARPRRTVGVTPRQRLFLRLGQGGVLLIAMTLLSPTSIKTHFGVLLLPLAVCVADYLWHGRDRVTGSVLLAYFLVSTLTVKGLVGLEAGNAIMSAGSVTLATLLLLYATGRIVLMRSRQWQGEERTLPERREKLARAA